jgi:hypothetical protein
MIKCLIYFLFVLANLFWECTVRAETQTGIHNDNGESIYFCTKDLDILKSIANENPANNNTGKGQYCAANKLNSTLLTKFRHCFVMIARKIRGNGSFYYVRN